MTYPSAPIDLTENLVMRTNSTLGLQWNDGASNGGSAIIQYVVSQSVDNGPFTVILTVFGKTGLSFDLTFGKSYSFKV